MCNYVPPRVLDRIVLLVMQNNAKEAIALMESEGFDRSILDDIGCCEAPLPLYKLSMCNAILLDKKHWREGYYRKIKHNVKGCYALLDYFRAQGYPVDEPLDFEPYEPECAFYKDWDWDIDALFDGDMDELVAMGYDEAEVELCHAVLTYNSALLKKHIERGTNPDVYISANLPVGKEVDDYDGMSHNALVSSNSCCADAFNCDRLGDFWIKDCVKEVDEYDVHLLLQAAAYRDLEKKLERIAEQYKR